MIAQTSIIKDTTKWSIPVPRRLDLDVEKAVTEGYASSKSELVRFAVVSYLRYLDEQRKVDRK
jgi:Arc/MetJ-type ribon-helix-helix transcriptional regulator